MIRQRGQHLASHRTRCLLRRGQDVDQHVDLGQRAHHVALGDHLEAGAGAGAAGRSAHLGAEGLQGGGEGLPDLPEPPDQHSGTEQRGEPSLGVQRLQAAQLRGPLVALLRLPALRQPSHQAQQQGQGVLAHRPRVQPGARGDHHVLGEPGGEDAVDPGRQRLHQLQGLQGLGGRDQVAPGSAPHHQHRGVMVLGGDLGAGVDRHRLPPPGQHGIERNGVWQQDLHASRVRRTPPRRGRSRAPDRPDIRCRPAGPVR